MSKIIKKLVLSTTMAPSAIGPYSQAVLVNKTIYVSGQLGMKADTMKLVEGGVAMEARQALFNLGYILQVADCTYDQVVKTNVLLEDINDFEEVNLVYEELFPGQQPAMSSCQVEALPRGAKVEIEAVAVMEK
jgi:2-iminobutanoate/2-iminopropanoate deaminase